MNCVWAALKTDATVIAIHCIFVFVWLAQWSLFTSWKYNPRYTSMFTCRSGPVLHWCSDSIQEKNWHVSMYFKSLLISNSFATPVSQDVLLAVVTNLQGKVPLVKSAPPLTPGELKYFVIKLEKTGVKSAVLRIHILTHTSNMYQCQQS